MFLCQVSSAKKKTKKPTATQKPKHPKSSGTRRFDASGHRGDEDGTQRRSARFPVFFPGHLRRSVRAQRSPARNPAGRAAPRRRQILESRWGASEGRLRPKRSARPSSATHRQLHLRSFIQTLIAGAQRFQHARTHTHTH